MEMSSHHYKHGKEMREILKRLDRCDACLNKKQHHLKKCYNINRGKRPKCCYCGKVDHETITCDGGEHSGSWIINERNKNEYENLENGLSVGMSLMNEESNEDKVKELENLQEKLIKTSIDKLDNIILKMPRHKNKIDREIKKAESCIANAEEARKTKCSQEVYQNRCVLDVHTRRVQKLKDELNKDKNENEINEYDKLEKK